MVEALPILAGAQAGFKSLRSMPYTLQPMLQHRGLELALRPDVAMMLAGVVDLAYRWLLRRVAASWASDQ